MTTSLHFVDGWDRAIHLRRTQSSAANSFGAVPCKKHVGARFAAGTVQDTPNPVLVSEQGPSGGSRGGWPTLCRN